MQSLLPETLDFAQKTEQGAKVSGIWPVSRLTRLAELLLENSGHVQVDLQFDRVQKRRVLMGELNVNLVVTCQRCLQAMNYSLHSQFQLARISSDDEAAELPEGYEPLLLESDDIRLSELIEDELLLAMPLVLAHQHDCSDFLAQQQLSLQREAAEVAEQKINSSPFAVLKGLHKEK